MHRLRIEFTFDDKVRRGETFFDIAHLADHAFGDVGRRIVRFVQAFGPDMIVQDRGARLHCINRVDDVRQDLVIHLDQLQRAFGDGVACRCDRSDGMTVKQRFFTGHRRSGHIARSGPRRKIGKVVARDHRLHTGKRFGCRCIDRLDDGVRMRAAQCPPEQHAREKEIGAEFRSPGHLVHAVVFDGVRADDIQFAQRIEFRIIENGRHDQAPLISSAAAITERTILS